MWVRVSITHSTGYMSTVGLYLFKCLSSGVFAGDKSKQPAGYKGQIWVSHLFSTMCLNEHLLWKRFAFDYIQYFFIHTAILRVFLVMYVDNYFKHVPPWCLTSDTC